MNEGRCFVVGRLAAGWVFAWTLATCGQVLAVGWLEGHARVPRVLRPAVGAAASQPASLMRAGGPNGYVELYEFDMWCGQQGYSENRVCRTGAPPYMPPSHDGLFRLALPAGIYSLLMHQPEWFVRPKVVPRILIEDGRTTRQDAVPAVDYSVAFGGDMGIWQRPGLKEPWAWARVWHQTFVARGTSITHVAFKLAGTKTDRVRVSIHADDGTADPSRWPQIGPERVIDRVGPLADQWAGWRSGEVPTRPGRRYALCLRDAAGSGRIGPFVRRDALGPGYEQGTAYADGRAQPFDIYAIISSDSDGTVIPYMRRARIKPSGLAGWATRWGQTWKAMGRSLAGMDLLVAGGEHWQVTATVRVRAGGPDGPQVGVTKKVHTAWWGPGSGFLGASYSPGEVRLRPGATYYMEVAAVAPSEGFNPYKVNHPLNAYPDGCAYRSGQACEQVDLEMTIIEYAAAGPVWRVPARPQPPRGPNLLKNGDFESGKATGQDSAPPDHWQPWSRAQTAFWYGPYGRGGSLAARVIGGNINGTSIDGGYVQRVGGLDPAKRYRLTGWCSSSCQTDAVFACYVGYDPTGQTDEPDAPTVVWTEMGRFSHEFEFYQSGPIAPRRDAISVWLRGKNLKPVALFFVDFDDFALEAIQPEEPVRQGHGG